MSLEGGSSPPQISLLVSPYSVMGSGAKFLGSVSKGRPTIHSTGLTERG